MIGILSYQQKFVEHICQWFRKLLIYVYRSTSLWTCVHGGERQGIFTRGLWLIGKKRAS